MSDRIIACPAKVIVTGAPCGDWAKTIVHSMENWTARHAALAQNRPVFNLVAI
jgi:hypothetical protein